MTEEIKLTTNGDFCILAGALPLVARQSSRQGVNEVTVFDKTEETGVTKPAEQEEEEPKTLWDMFMQYMKNKEKAQDNKFVEAI
jgi:hypothetical protein